jgi:hypothetical protein
MRSSTPLRPAPPESREAGPRSGGQISWITKGGPVRSSLRARSHPGLVRRCAPTDARSDPPATDVFELGKVPLGVVPTRQFRDAHQDQGGVAERAEVRLHLEQHVPSFTRSANLLDASPPPALDSPAPVDVPTCLARFREAELTLSSTPTAPALLRNSHSRARSPSPTQDSSS